MGDIHGRTVIFREGLIPPFYNSACLHPLLGCPSDFFSQASKLRKSLGQESPLQLVGCKGNMVNETIRVVRPGRLTWNLQITHLERKMIFQTSMIIFHVSLQGCIINFSVTVYLKYLHVVSATKKINMTIGKRKQHCKGCKGGTKDDLR